jgi:hypothetical protein
MTGVLGSKTLQGRGGVVVVVVAADVVVYVAVVVVGSLHAKLTLAVHACAKHD